jgi:hypothetical protein
MNYFTFLPSLQVRLTNICGTVTTVSRKNEPTCLILNNKNQKDKSQIPYVVLPYRVVAGILGNLLQVQLRGAHKSKTE